MNRTLIGALLFSTCVCGAARGDGTVVFSGEKKRNNLVSVLLEVAAISKSGNSFPFTRSGEGWIFVSAAYAGNGKLKILLDLASAGAPVVLHAAENGAGQGALAEAVRRVAKGEHKIRVDCEGDVRVDKLVVKSIPELVQCGLNSSSIKSYGPFDLAFLKKDVLPNVTTLIVSPGIKLSQPVIDDWHRQGKEFLGEVGLNREGRTGEANFELYTRLLDEAPFLDGLVMNYLGIDRNVWSVESVH